MEIDWPSINKAITKIGKTPKLTQAGGEKKIMPKIVWKV